MIEYEHLWKIILEKKSHFLNANGIEPDLVIFDLNTYLLMNTASKLYLTDDQRKEREDNGHYGMAKIYGMDVIVVPVTQKTFEVSVKKFKPEYAFSAIYGNESEVG